MRFVFSAFIRYYDILKDIDNKLANGQIEFVKDMPGIKNILASKHYPEQVVRAIDYAKDVENVNLIIDSGAFSVWNMGGKLDVNDYIKFLKDFEKEHMSKFKEVWFVNLDVIPGNAGDREITQQQIDDAAEEGFQNYLKLRNEGWDNVIHVYHQGEDSQVLQQLLDINPEYIGISPSNDSTTSARTIWLDKTFQNIEKMKGYVKTHGFAVTSMNLMNRENWFSVDSTSWFMIGMYGKLCIPMDEYGEIILNPDQPMFDKFEVSLSERKKDNPVDGYNFFYKHKPGKAKQIDKYMEQLNKIYQIHPEQLCSSRNEGRVAANLLMFLRWEKQFKHVVHKPVSMF